MQPITLIAENHITITKKLFNEAIHTAENKSYLKESKLLLLTLAVLYLLVAAVSLTLFFSIFYSIIFANSTSPNIGEYNFQSLGQSFSIFTRFKFSFIT